MKKGLSFNLADRDKHFESLKQLYGDSHVKEETHRQEADTQPAIADADTERVSRVQGILGICPADAIAKKISHKARQ
jgi:hypothetical protein